MLLFVNTEMCITFSIITILILKGYVIMKMFDTNTIIRIFLPIVLGTVVGLITQSQMDYSMLVNPPLSPPGFIFPIVWSILYLLMGTSYALVSKEDTLGNIKAVYYAQLFVNLLWSIFFFVFKWRLFTIFWTILLLGLIIYYMIRVFHKNKTSFYLFIPYLVWVLFATYLTIGIYLLN